MQTGSIKISELNAFTSSLQGEDFFPLVDSSSMTTFRANLTQLSGILGTVSGSLFASRSLYATSASWASSSISSSYSLSASFATTAGKVNLTPSNYYIPMWYNGYPSNSNLGQTDSDMYMSSSKLVLDASTTLHESHMTNAANCIEGATPEDYDNSASYHGGLVTAFPIISTCFLGIDQKYWFFQTGSNPHRNQFWSGSEAWIPFSSASGAIADEFNGKWIRVVAYPWINIGGFTEQNETQYNEPYFREMIGRLRFDIYTGVSGSNVRNTVEMKVWNGFWGGSIGVEVCHNECSGIQIIDQIRVAKAYSSASMVTTEIFDPHLYIDIRLDNISDDDSYIILQAKSYADSHIRFVKEPTIGPPAPINEGALLPNGPYKLEFAPNVGTYLYVPETFDYGCMDQIVAGRRLRIDPDRRTITGSRRANYALEVSGTIGGQGFYNKDQEGKDGTFVAYNPISSAWSSLTYSGGILVNSASAGGSSPTSSVTIAGNVPIGTIVDWAGADSASLTASGWFVCDGQWYSQATYPDAYTALGGTSNPWGNGTAGSGWNSGDSSFKVPDLRKRTTVGAYPGGTATNYQIAVGKTGGDEDFMEAHFHYFATRAYMVDNYDDLIFQWATKTATSTGHASSVKMDTAKMVQEGRTHWFYLDGDLEDSTGLQRSTEFRQYAQDRSWDLVTSYPYNDNGVTEQVPPYAVVHKIIRLR
jgi:hypothetical protein